MAAECCRVPRLSGSRSALTFSRNSKLTREDAELHFQPYKSSDDHGTQNR